SHPGLLLCRQRRGGGGLSVIQGEGICGAGIKRGESGNEGQGNIRIRWTQRNWYNGEGVLEAEGPDICAGACRWNEGNAIRAGGDTWLHERPLSTPQQINFQNVHVGSMKLGAFFAIFAQPWLTFIDWRENFNTGHQAVVCGVTDFDRSEP